MSSSSCDALPHSSCDSDSDSCQCSSGYLKVSNTFCQDIRGKCLVCVSSLVSISQTAGQCIVCVSSLVSISQAAGKCLVCVSSLVSCIYLSDCR